MFEERFQAARAANIFFDFLDLPERQSLPTRTRWGVFPQAVEKKLNLAQGKPHGARETDEEHTVEGVLAVAPLAAGALRCSEKAAFFVVADSGSVAVGAAGELSYLHSFLRVISATNA